MSKWNLGSDKITTTKIVSIFIYLLITSFLIWVIVNDPMNFKYGLIYFSMMTLWFIATLFDLTFKNYFRGGDLIDTVSEEPREKRPFRILKNLTTFQYLLIVFVICGTVFFSIQSTGKLLVTAPTFQVLSFTQSLWYSSFLTGLVGVMETLFFFCFIFPTIYSLIYLRTREIILSLFTSILITSLIFVGFHSLVYGTANIVASISVFIFGIRECIFIYLFRSAFLPIADHFTNNFCATWFNTHIVSALI